MNAVTKIEREPSTALATYVESPVILSAHSARGYTSIQLELHRKAMERKQRLMPITARPGPEPVPHPVTRDASLEPALRRCRAKVAKLRALYAQARRENGLRGRPRSSIQDIQRIVAHKYGITVPDILSRRIDIVASRPRQIAMYLARVVTWHSFAEVGKRFDDRDHTCVMHAVRLIEMFCAEDAVFREEIEDLKHFITGDVDFLPMKAPRPHITRRVGGIGIAAKVLTAMENGASTAAEAAEAINVNVLSVAAGIGYLTRTGKIVYVREAREKGRKFFVYAVAKGEAV